jgi:hypothetical protein
MARKMGSGGTGVWLWQLVSYQALRNRGLGLSSGKRPSFSTRITPERQGFNEILAAGGDILITQGL